MINEIEHPAFPQPDNNPSIWRYLDLSKFEWMLENQRLFFPMAENLGDPLEGTQPIGDSNWWDDQAEKASSDKERSIITNNKNLISKISKLFRSGYYVSCWHINEKENLQMWGSYTHNSQSVAIRTSYNSIRSILPNYINIGVVRYIDYATEKLPPLNMFEYITHKHISFEFENELRVVAFPPVGNPVNEKHFKDNHCEMISNPDFQVFSPSIVVSDFILDIVLHPESTSEFSKKIVSMCEKSSLSFPKKSVFSTR